MCRSWRALSEHTSTLPVKETGVHRKKIVLLAQADPSLFHYFVATAQFRDQETIDKRSGGETVGWWENRTDGWRAGGRTNVASGFFSGTRVTVVVRQRLV